MVSEFFHRRGTKSTELFYTAALPIKRPLRLCVSVVKNLCKLRLRSTEFSGYAHSSSMKISSPAITTG
jgi:hypothetical protein